MTPLPSLAVLVSCVTFDDQVFNGVPCTQVDEETCNADDAWNAVCVPCEQPYDWTLEYPWFDRTLQEGQTVRPIPDELVTRVAFETNDGAGELDAYFVATHGEDADNADVTIVYNHGNYASIEHYIPRVRYLHEAGYNVFVWDYRGYGKSTITTHPTGAQHLADARKALDVALSQPVPDPDRVVVYGYSVGSLAATSMAVEEHSCALVLEAPFTSFSSITRTDAKLSLGDQFLGSGAWDNFRRMEHYEGPTLGMSGTEDHLFPPHEVEALVRSGSGPSEMWILDGVHHGVSDIGIPEDGLTTYLDRLDGFLAEHCP